MTTKYQRMKNNGKIWPGDIISIDCICYITKMLSRVPYEIFSFIHRTDSESIEFLLLLREREKKEIDYAKFFQSDKNTYFRARKNQSSAPMIMIDE